MEKAPYTEEEFSSAKRRMDRLVADSLKGRDAKQNVVFARLSEMVKRVASGTITWSRKNSLWPFQFELACCSLELLAFGSARSDDERGGYSMFRTTPGQADVMVVAGWVTKSMVPEIRKLYEQMLEPRYVIAFGECATCGGPWWESYNVIKGVDQVLPVDVYVAGCPPRPENLFAAFMKLQKKIGDRVVKSKRK